MPYSTAHAKRTAVNAGAVSTNLGGIGTLDSISPGGFLSSVMTPETSNHKPLTREEGTNKKIPQAINTVKTTKLTVRWDIVRWKMDNDRPNQKHFYFQGVTKWNWNRRNGIGEGRKVVLH